MLYRQDDRQSRTDDHQQRSEVLTPVIAKFNVTLARVPIRRISCVVLCVFVVIMGEPIQRQQERISKSSWYRLRAQLVRSGVDEGEVGQMDRGELKAAEAQIEVEKPWHVDARLQPLPDEGEELFLPPQVVAPNYEYEVLEMKMELRKMELAAEKEARKAEAEARKVEVEKEARKLEAEKEARQAEARRVEREAEARMAEREVEARRAEREAERETRKMEVEMELMKIELQAKVQGGDDESGATGLEGTAAAASDHSLTGRTKKFVMP